MDESQQRFRPGASLFPRIGTHTNGALEVVPFIAYARPSSRITPFRWRPYARLGVPDVVLTAATIP